MKKQYNIVKITNNKKQKVKDIVVKEYPLKIFINSMEFSTLLCSPDKLKYLIIGNLYSENIIRNIKEIKGIKINEFDGIADVELKKDVSFIKIIKRGVVYSGCATFYSLKNLKIKKIKNIIKIDARK